MALSMSRGRKNKPFEVVRIQYGAWDDPGVSVFATLQQEPMPNMIRLMRREKDDRTKDSPDAEPIKVQFASPRTKTVFQTIKYQVERIAADRNSKLNLFADELRENETLAAALAVERDRQLVNESRQKQLHTNSYQLRELDNEILRAHTALKVKHQMQSLKSTQENQRVKDLDLGRRERERLREELHQERDALRKKAEIYRQQLTEQIKDSRQRCQSQHEADIKEGRQKRHNYETQLAAALKREAENKMNNRLALKKSQEDFEAMQKAIKEAKCEVNDPDVTVLEALNQTTRSYIAQSLQRREKIIDMRTDKSERLGIQLSEIKYAKDSREDLITGLLVSEHKAKEDEMAYRNLVERKKKKFIVRDELLNQRQEQAFYRQKAEVYGKLIPYDETCFSERQHREYTSYERAMNALNKNTYKDLAAMIVSNARRRVDEAEEERVFRQHLIDLQTNEDVIIAEERMRMLQRQPEEIIQSLRTTLLTEKEIKAFNLHGSDTKSHH